MNKEFDKKKDKIIVLIIQIQIGNLKTLILNVFKQFTELLERNKEHHSEWSLP